MKDLTGQRFGRQVAIKPVGINKYRNYLWLCKCDCGNEHIVASGKLVQGKSRSCGCLANDMHIKQLEKHGITTGGKPRTFNIWNGMKARCLNPKSISFKNYGGRGILICDEWLLFENFHNWAMASGYDDELTIDRINNDGNYEPSNCRWENAKINISKQRKTRYIEVYGITKNVTQWCKLFKVSRATAYKYLNESEDIFIEFCKGQQYFINKFLGNKQEVD